MILMKALVGIFFLALTILGTACAAEDVSEYRTALNANYVDYQIVDVTDESQRQRRQSPDSFDNDILVGDFNFDNHKDFAAILSRKATETDPEQIPADRRQLEAQVFFAVVCNGLVDSSERQHYDCVPLSDTVVGGFGPELDLLDLSKWGDLSKVHDAYGNAQCPIKMRSLSSNTLLSLKEPFGRCTTFYYPESDGGYGQCTFCAD